MHAAAASEAIALARELGINDTRQLAALLRCD